MDPMPDRRPRLPAVRARLAQTLRLALARSIALPLAVACLVAGCDGGDGDAPAPKPRAWSILSEGHSAGAWMAGARLPGGGALLVGGQAQKGAVARLTGTTLELEAVPDGKLLSWVSVMADGGALVVGNGRRALWRSPTGTWTAEALPAGDVLWGCIAFSATDAWAVGADEPAAFTYRPVLLRRDAAGWKEVTLPSLPKEREAAQLFKIDGHGPDDLLAVGDLGLALHYDGKVWKEEPTGTGTNLVTTRALPDGRYVVVGGTASGVIYLRGADGVWTLRHEPMIGLSGVDLDGDELVVAGAYGWIEHVPLALGGKARELDEVLTSDVLHFVLRLANGELLAGGGNLQVWPNPMQGTVLRFGR